jgi:hypothetical protein
MAAIARPGSGEDTMADTTHPTDAERAAARRYLPRFEVTRSGRGRCGSG